MENNTTLELYKLAEEKGYKFDTPEVYEFDKESGMWSYNSAPAFNGRFEAEYDDILNARDNGYEAYLAPSFFDIHMWLMEVHDIRIFPNQIRTGKFSYEIFTVLGVISNKKHWKTQVSFKVFDNYTHALVTGLIEALNLIKI